MIREENAITALEVMSRFAVNPRWLIYLPPTMSPSETSRVEGFLEHPADAFAYFRQQGVGRVICEEKHMGSRAVVIVCPDEDAARQRFGVVDGEIGICYTRTGRRFFEDAALEREFLSRIRDAATAAGLWEELDTDWLCLDCELMPWSVKAQELIRQEYAAVGASARPAMSEALTYLRQAEATGSDVADLLERYQSKQDMTDRYVAAYRHYCWPVNTIDDLKLAPFHLLASEGKVHVDRDHSWHMETLAKLCREDSNLLRETPHMAVDVTDPTSQEEGITWWRTCVGAGGEGMVIKPIDFIARGRRDLVQPALKCRGPEYLRIIYGPEYSAPENLERLRSRGLSAKRSLALREFALGIEALERFVRREPLYRTHECAFAVLALESEPIDPRL
jgi:protein phosphatase